MQLKMNIENVVTEFFDSCIKGTPAAKNTALLVRVRFQLDAFDVEDADDEGNNTQCRIFNILYFSPNNYTKVLWRETDFRDTNHDGFYDLIADHDSCWRDAWDPIERRADVILERFKSHVPAYVKTNIHISIDRIQQIAISSYESCSRADSYNLDRAADDSFTLTVNGMH